MVELATLLFLFLGGFSVPGFFIAAVDGRHTSSSAASRRKSLADRHDSLTRRSRLLPCTRCFARARRGVARVATYKCQRGDAVTQQRSETASWLNLLLTCFLVFLVSSVSGCVFRFFGQKNDRGGFCRSAALKDCWLVELTS